MKYELEINRISTKHNCSASAPHQNLLPCGRTRTIALAPPSKTDYITNDQSNKTKTNSNAQQQPFILINNSKNAL